MVKGTRQYWEHNQVNLASTTTPVKICTLHKGESAWIKAHIENTGYIYLGNDEHVSSSNGYLLEQGEGVEMKYDSGDDDINYIEVWAIPATANDDIVFFRNIKIRPFKNKEWKP